MLPDRHVPVLPPPGRYVVTGGSGFIGARLLWRLAAAGREALALDVRAPSTVAPGHGFEHCDLRDAARVKCVLASYAPDYVVHLAARVGDWGSFTDFEAINVTGVRHVLDAAVASGARRIVHVSSIAAMGFDAGAIADESVGPFATGDPYSATKGAGEMVAREFQRVGAPVVVLRPGDVYGVGSVPWVERPVALMRAGRMVLVEGGHGHFAHVHVDNLLDALLLALSCEGAVGETFLVTDGDTHCTIGAYFRRLAEAAGVPPPTRSVPRIAARALGAVMEFGARVTGRPPAFTRVAVDFVLRRGSFSIEKARRVLHWAPRVDLDEGLAEIRAHYQGGGG